MLAASPCHGSEKFLLHGAVFEEGDRSLKHTSEGYGGAVEEDDSCISKQGPSSSLQ